MGLIALAAGVRWPRGGQLGWVVLAGLLLQAVQFSGFAVAAEMQGALTAGGLLLAIQLTASAAFMAVVAVIGPGFHVPITYAALAPIVWLTLGLSIVAIMLFFWLLRRQKGGEATSFLYVVPSLTAIAAVPVLGQSLNPGVVVGFGAEPGWRQPGRRRSLAAICSRSASRRCRRCLRRRPR